MTKIKGQSRIVRLAATCCPHRWKWQNWILIWVMKIRKYSIHTHLHYLQTIWNRLKAGIWCLFGQKMTLQTSTNTTKITPLSKYWKRRKIRIPTNLIETWGQTPKVFTKVKKKSNVFKTKTMQFYNKTSSICNQNWINNTNKNKKRIKNLH